MEKGTWRNLILAALAGLAAYVACVYYWPIQKPRTTIEGEWRSGSIRPWLISPDGTLISANNWILRTSDGKCLVFQGESDCAFSPKNDVLVLFSKHSLELFDARTGSSIDGSLREFSGEKLVS